MNEKRLLYNRLYMRKYGHIPEQRAKTYERIKRRLGRINEWLNSYKEQKGCCLCPEHDPRCLDFHHRDPESKATPRGGISQIVHRWSFDRIKTEVEKCDIYCGNCHRAVHVTEPKNKGSRCRRDPPSEQELAKMSKGRRYYWRNQAKCIERKNRRVAELLAWFKSLKASGCCCGEKRPECLDYHHRDPTTKEQNLSKLVYSCRSKEHLLEEIEKCDLICANCHRKEHYHD